MSNTHVCPWWAGYTLNWSIRRIAHSPERILAPYLKAGQTMLDVGCGMGYFTIPAARLLGEVGSVIAVDLQQEMLDGVRRNAEKAGVSACVVPHKCEAHSLGLDKYAGAVDLALTFMMVHEVPDRDRLVFEIRDALRTGGLLLFAEPILHVGKAAFEDSLRRFIEQGFHIVERPRIVICRTAVLEKI